MGKKYNPAPATLASPSREGFADEVNEVMQQLLPDQDTSSIPLFAMATTAAKLLESFNQRNLKPFGYNYTEYLVLALLRTTPGGEGVPPTVLNQTLMLTTGGLTQTIKRLEKAGLVERSPNPVDGRSVVLVLTSRGEELADKMLTAQAQAQRQRLSWLSEGQRKQLLASLQTLVKVLS